MPVGEGRVRRISDAVGVEVVVFESADATDKKDITKVNIADRGVGSNVYRVWVGRSLLKTRLLDFSHQICICGNIDQKTGIQAPSF